jgi:hypothetical protein
MVWATHHEGSLKRHWCDELRHIGAKTLQATPINCGSELARSHRGSAAAHEADEEQTADGGGGDADG